MGQTKGRIITLDMAIIDTDYKNKEKQALTNEK